MLNQNLHYKNDQLRRKKTVLSGICLGLLLSLSSCANETIFQTTNVIHEKSHLIAAQRQQQLAQNLQMTENSAPTQWWRLFDDPVLNQLQQQVVATNFDYQNALLRIDESQAALGQVASSLKPQVSIDADYSRQAISQYSPFARLGASKNGYNLWTMGLQSSWELDLWGYLRHQQNAAQAQVEAKFYQAKQVKSSLSAELTRNYVLLRNIQAKQGITQHLIDLQQNMIRVYIHKQQYGVATNMEISVQKAELLQIQQQLNVLNQQSDILKNNIAQLLALAPNELNYLLNTPSTLTTPHTLPIGLASDFVKNRPDILTADAELRASIDTVYAAKADFYPRIGLSAQIGKQAFSLSDYSDWDSRTYGFGPTLHLPIFNGGQLKSTLTLTQARQKQAAVHYQQTVLNAWHEIDHAFIDYQQSQQNSSLLQKQFIENQKILKVANNQLKQGLSDRTQTLQAEMQIAQTQLSQIANQTATQLSIISLYRALGSEGAELYNAHLSEEKSL